MFKPLEQDITVVFCQQKTDMVYRGLSAQLRCACAVASGDVLGSLINESPGLDYRSRFCCQDIPGQKCACETGSQECLQTSELSCSAPQHIRGTMSLTTYQGEGVESGSVDARLSKHIFHIFDATKFSRLEHEWTTPPAGQESF